MSTVSLDDGSAASPSLNFTNDSDMGLYRLAADTIGIAVNGGEVGRISTFGVQAPTRDKGGQVHNILAYGAVGDVTLTAATATASVAGGVVTGISVTGGGAWYGFTPAVTINGVGAGATAHAVLTGRTVTSIVVDNGGSGYTAPPTVTIQSVKIGTDDSSAIQAAITAAGAGGTVWIPSGRSFLIDTPINLTNTDGITLAGWGNVYPGPDMGGLPIFDCSGAAGIRFDGLVIGDTANASHPSCAVLIANSSTRTAASNVHFFDSVSISGTYTKAALYNCAGVSSRSINCQFQNYDASAPAVFFTANNAGSITSPYVTISATGGVGEWGFWGCEFHAIELSAPAIILESTYSVSLYGGNISANGLRAIEFRGANVNLTVDSVVCYTDTDTVTNWIYATSGASVNGMKVINCRLDADTAVLGGANGTLYTRPILLANTINGSPSKIVGFTTGGIIAGGIIDCVGLTVDCGNGDLQGGVKLLNPGAVIASGGNASIRELANGGLLSSAGIGGRELVNLGTVVTPTSFDQQPGPDGRWGGGATMSAYGGTKMAGFAEYTAGSGGISASPRITITWPDGGFLSATSYRSALWLEWTDDTTITSSPPIIQTTGSGAPNKAAAWIQWEVGITPVAGKKYRFSWFNIGA